MKVLFFSFSILIASISFAQQEYLITIQGDTINGDIDIYQRTYYDEVQVKNDEGRNTFKAYQIIAARKDGETYEPITYSNKKVIAQVVKKGELSLYKARPENDANFRVNVFYKNEEPLEVGNIGFRKILANYLSDCPILVKELENKEINPSDLDYILTTYNSSCSKKVIEKSVEIDFSDLKELSQLLNDVISRMDKSEEVPAYMINALKEYSEKSTDSKIKALIKSLEEK